MRTDREATLPAGAVKLINLKVGSNVAAAVGDKIIRSFLYPRAMGSFDAKSVRRQLVANVVAMRVVLSTVVPVSQWSTGLIPGIRCGRLVNSR